nr:hypothetical protein [Petrachloros mirabilis]
MNLRSLLAFLVVLTCVIGGDLLLDAILQHTDLEAGLLRTLYPVPNFQELEIDFAPEVWLALVGLSLGTLIIVISIAAQSIPKIVELYMQDWVSLVYIWFVILGSAQSIYIKFYRDTEILRASSIILNLYVFLPAFITFSFPYIYYVLKGIQPTVVIEKISRQNIKNIRRLTTPSNQALVGIESYREAYQLKLLESLNQLDSMLHFVSFKEPKAQIIQYISLAIREFIPCKSRMGTDFFRVGDVIRADISFKTLIDQFPLLERNHTFYEQKCFRILGNAYVYLLEESEFDLASLCASEMSKVGLAALSIQAEKLLNLIVIRFNTMLRFALKHGVKNNEARNLYNLAFHYRTFIEALVRHGQVASATQSFYYLRSYGNEIYAYGRTSPAMYFIVDVFAAEMKKILIQVYYQHWPLSTQRHLLEEMLQVDSPPEVDVSASKPRHLNHGVRALQIGLALFYLKVEQLEFVERIIADILEDLEILGEPAFRQAIAGICDRIRNAQPTFWEDTDRGTANLYYAPERDQLSRFCNLLEARLTSGGSSA